MSGRRFLALGCVYLTLLAVYACGDDDGVLNAPDELVDASQPDGALTAQDGSTSDRYVPPTEFPPSSLALGEGFGCIVGADRMVYCWGKNDSGQLGVDPAKTPSTPIPVKVEGVNNVVAITAGKNFACALDDSKDGWCWGSNAKNQVLGKGAPFVFTPKLVSNGTARIAAAGQHACILDKDGFLYCWGDNDCDLFGGSSDGGAVDVITLAVPEAKAFSIGPDAMCFVSKTVGEVFCWGADHKGSLGHPLPSNVTTCAGGVPFDPLPKRWVANKEGVILQGVEDVHVGSAITCARKTDGTTLCAGDNSHGGLGQGLPDGDRHEVALEVKALKAEKVVVAGETGCALTAGKLLCWGDARYGQMPTGDLGTDCGGTGCRPLGYVIPGQENLRDLAIGPGNIGTIKNDVSVWIWGRNDSGETGFAKDDPANTTCAGGTPCIAGPRQMPNVPVLK